MTTARPPMIGIGLPAAVPGAAPGLAEWARRAERRGFSSLGVIDRLLYPNLEPLIALAAAATVTSTIRLAATVFIAPLRSNHALFAKQLAAVDAISNGRLVVGFGVGVRRDDYEVSEVSHGTRGRLLDRQLDRVMSLFEEARNQELMTIGPALPPGRPEVLIGGMSDAAFTRLVRHGDGWISGRAGLPMFAQGAPRAVQAWSDAGRPGRPHLAALAYFALGEEARAIADRYLDDYYGFDAAASEGARRGVAVSRDGVLDLMAGFAAAGCDELIFMPSSPDPSQVDLLADAVGLS